MSTYDASTRSPERMYAALRTFWMGDPPPRRIDLTVAFLAGYAAGRIHAEDDASLPADEGLDT